MAGRFEPYVGNFLCKRIARTEHSYALSGDDDKAHAAGCDGYVTKPFSPRQLLETIRHYLS
jgi:CheY-like chemotaxis protein